MARLFCLLQASATLLAAFSLCGCHGIGKPNGGGSASLPATLAPVLNNNGVMLLEHDRGDAAGAIAVFEKAVQADPKYAIGWLNLGIAHCVLPIQDYKKALDALNHASDAGCRDLNLYFARGWARSQLQDLEGAKADFQKVVDGDPTDAYSRYHLGTTLAHLNKYEDAVKQFQDAVKILPDLQSAWYGLGQALGRLGRTAEATAANDRMTRLLETKTGVAVSDRDYFAGLGRHMEPQPDPNGPKRAPGGPMVAFSDATATALPGVPKYTWTAGEIPAFGAAWGDYDNDGKPDLIVCQAKSVQLYHNESGVLKAVASSGLVYPGGSVQGASWGDFDNDGSEDVALYGTMGARLFRNSGKGTFVLAFSCGTIGLIHATWVDFDHDGFLDLLTVGVDGKARLYRNNGSSSFTDVTAISKIDAVTHASYALPTDYDKNRAVDLLLVDAEGAPSLLRSNYSGTFSPVKDAAGLTALGKCRQIAAADVNSDGLIDYIAATDRGVQIAIHQPDHTFKIQPILGASTTLIVHSIAVADFDKDGNVDVIALSANMAGMGGDTHFALYQGAGDGTFKDVTAQAGLDKVMTRNSARLVIADIDGNGSLDVVSPGAQPLLLKNAGNANHWVRLNLRGLKVSPAKDHRTGLRTNGSGLGATVEAWTEATWAMTEVTAASGDDHQPVMGLGATAMPRWVRILWPSGVHECEPIGDQKAADGAGVTVSYVTGRDPGGQITNSSNVYRMDNSGEQFLSRFNRGPDLTDIPGKIDSTWLCWEPNRAPTSCPVLYTWDGSKYRFITDLQGGAIIGYNVGEYQYAPNDPDEYVSIPEGAMALKDGKYDVEIADQLQEILYIDAVHLLAVDHPAATIVFSNDRMKAAPPFPTFAPISVDEIRPPKAVMGNHGENVLPLVSRIDRQYPDDFEKLKFEGFAKRHTLTVDLGDTTAAKKVYLLLYGWQKYAHSSSNLAAAHAGVYGESPSVQVQGPDGRWKTVIKDMGAVAGLPKWLAVDVTPWAVGSRQSAVGTGTAAGRSSAVRRPSSVVRISTNLELFWDKIDVGILRGGGMTRVTRVTPSEANYHWLGYPKPQFPDGREPVVYDFDQRREGAPWWTPAGYYTRTGDITELLQKPDDKYVIMRHGHAMHIRFDSANLPPLPSGWKRDFVLMSDGFGKDMDMNGATAMTVNPLPFHKMTRYPYGRNEHYPTDRDHLDYLQKYNTFYQWGAGSVAQWPELHLKGE